MVGQWMRESVIRTMVSLRMASCLEHSTVVQRSLTRIGKAQWPEVQKYPAWLAGKVQRCAVWRTWWLSSATMSLET